MKWSDYFPFQTGTELELEASALFFSAEGTGNVINATDNRLELSFEIPKQSFFGFEFGAKGSLIIDVKADGDNNYCKIDIDGKEYVDNNLRISKRPERHRITIDPSIDIADRDLNFKIRRKGSSRAEIADISGLPIPLAVKVVISRA